MPDDPLPLIATTLGKLEERTRGIQDDVTEVKKDQKEFREEVKQDNRERNGRIRTLETWRQRITGGVILLGLFAPLFVLGIRESIADLLGIGG